ncbi:hypothetical protein PAXRUDRAFT_162532, partial [Paxillus rubicundulus Ve08.2h10]
PTNIQMEFFKPNLTLFVQPCDVGIICCLKAIYCWKFSICTIDLNKVGKQEIYKINLLEAMLMVKSTWDAVSPETIKHCGPDLTHFWDHTQIQLDSTNLPTSPSSSHPPHANPVGWKIVGEFSTT